MSTSSSMFSSVGYEALIGALLARGYRACSFADMFPASRDLILRHDVDFSLDAARTMAEQEAGLGIQATYFVLLRTEFYNLMSRAGQTALERIAVCGHTVGLHFDAALYPQGDIEEAIAKECTLLESISGRPVTIISFHRPTKDRVGESDRLAGRLNAYGPSFVKAIGYCSDSRGVWRFGHPLDHPAVHEGRALQLLVHPFWWTDPAMSPQDRLRKYLARRAAFFDDELARHCVVHVPQGR